MHACLIALEGYIDTLHYLFVHDTLAGCIWLGIQLNAFAFLLLGWHQTRSKGRSHARSHGGPNESVCVSNADEGVQGRNAPLFTVHDDAFNTWHGMHHDFGPSVNTNGLPMICGTGIDVAGNPYGST